MGLRTPLFERHVAAGARMVDFGGWDMPLQYTAIRDEHEAVRERAGLFDVSHMGEVWVTGAGALAAVRHLVANDAGRLAPGQSLYGVMCREDAGIVDDVVVARAPDGERYLVTVNASRHDVDLAWMRSGLRVGAAIDDASNELALLAVQGPLAVGIVERVCGAPISDLRPFHTRAITLSGVATTCHVSRTGYTGEDGVEIYLEAAGAGPVWDLLLSAGAEDGLEPCGLGARDTLRLEAGLRLYGQDMDETVDPYSAGLGWTVRLDRDPFLGSDALRRLERSGPPRRTVGLALPGRSIARHGQHVLSGDRHVGVITSGTYGFTVGHGVALALIDADAATLPTLTVDIRGTVVEARIVPLPFRRRAAV